jgi:hypothetical protein
MNSDLKQTLYLVAVQDDSTSIISFEEKADRVSVA